MNNVTHLTDLDDSANDNGEVSIQALCVALAVKLADQVLDGCDIMVALSSMDNDILTDKENRRLVVFIAEAILAAPDTIITVAIEYLEATEKNRGTGLRRIK